MNKKNPDFTKDSQRHHARYMYSVHGFAARYFNAPILRPVLSDGAFFKGRCSLRCKE